MSITLEQEPNKHQPAYNPLNYILSSSNSANDDFRYKVDITVNGVVRSSLFVQPRPTTENAWVDVHRIVEVFVKDNPEHLLTPTSAIEKANNYATYKIDVTEFEGGASGDVYNGNTLFANSMSLDWQRYIAQSYDDYPDKEFLTLRRNVSLRDDTLYQLNFISNFVDLVNPEVAKVRYQPLGGSIVDIANPMDDALDLSEYYLSVLVGFDHLSISEPSFEVWLADSSNNVLGDKIRFTRNTECVRPTDTVVYYQNRLGGWDALNFYANPLFLTEVNRIRYSRVLGSEISDNYTYSASEHQIVTASAKYNDKITLRHNWMSDEESESMVELLTSTICYASFDGSALVPIVVKSESYEKQYRQRNRLFAGEIEIQLAYDNITQRR